MKRKSLSVTVTKVVQAAQFEPLTVSITEVAELEEGDKVKKVRARLYESVSDSVHAVMKEELTRWKRKSKS